jgi:hypothetical protein
MEAEEDIVDGGSHLSCAGVWAEFAYARAETWNAMVKRVDPSIHEADDICRADDGITAG